MASGYWSGWADYRYGQKRKPTLPQVFKGEKRKHMISEVMDNLKDWRITPFENEGAVRSGLRAAMCLIGHSWPVADNEVAGLITASFQRMGAHRPSWDQGQRQYVIAAENCNWCGVDLPDEDRAGSRRARFCSSVCAQSAIQHRDYESRKRDDAVARSALSIIFRDQLPTQKCEYCDREFKPFNVANKDQRHCSHRCSRLALRTIQPRNCLTCKKEFRPRLDRTRYCSSECAHNRVIEPRPCQCCEKPFIPKTAQGVVCSKACHMRLHRIRKAEQRGTTYKPLGSTFDGTCRHCSEPFMATSPKAVYCSPRCNSAAFYLRRKSNIIPFVPMHMLTAQVFDGWFRRAA